MQNNIKINWNFLYGILMGFIVLLTLETLKIQLPVWGIIGTLILSQPLVMKSGNVYSLWGGFSENSIYSLVPIIQLAKYDTIGILGVSLFQKAGNNSTVVAGIILFQSADNNSGVYWGASILQKAGNDCRLELGMSIFQTFKKNSIHGICAFVLISNLDA